MTDDINTKRLCLYTSQIFFSDWSKEKFLKEYPDAKIEVDFFENFIMQIMMKNQKQMAERIGLKKPKLNRKIVAGLALSIFDNLNWAKITLDSANKIDILKGDYTFQSLKRFE